MSIRFLTVVFLSLFSITSLMAAENDDLFQKLSKASLKEKPSVLNQIAQSYIPASPNKGLQYALQAIDLAKQTRNKYQEALALKIVGAAYYNLFKYAEALKAYQNAIDLFRIQKDFNNIAAIYLNIGLIYRDQNLYIEAGDHYMHAILLYDSIKNISGKASAYNLQGGLAWKQGNYNQALKEYQKVLNIRLQLKVPADIANAYNRIALAYKDMGDFDHAIENYTLALDFFQKLGDKKLQANNLNDIGSVYWKKNDFEKALEFYFKSVKLRYETDDKNGIAGSYINIGSVYFNLDNYQKAKEYYMVAHNLYSETLQQKHIASTLTLLGTCESKLNNNPEAVDFYSSALAIRRKLGDQKDIAISLNNLGNIHAEINQPAKAIKLFNEALSIRTSLKDTAGLIITLNDMGNLFEKISDYAKAKYYFNQTLLLSQKIADNYHISLCYRKLSEIGVKTNESFEVTNNQLKLSIQYANAIQNLELLKNSDYAYYLFYSKFRNFEQALKSYLSYTAKNDSLQNLKNNRRITSIQQNIEIEKKNNELRAYENEVKLLRQDKELQNLVLNRQQQIRNGLIIISILILIVAALFIYLYYIKRNVNQRLSEHNKTIRHTNEQLLAREAELKKLNATKDKYFSVIAHDIKNPLSALMNLSHIIVEKFDSLKADDLQKFNKMIYESADNLHKLLENLLYWARTNTDKIKYHPENIKLKTLINNVFLINKLSASQKNINLVDKSEPFEVYADLQMLTSILRNLISNGIKFTHEGGNIEINAKNSGRYIEISVSDNGIGMETENVNKLFQLDTGHTTRGTNNEVGTGLGLILVKEFVEKNQGKISVLSEPGKGTTFTFTIPNSTW